MKIKCTIKRKSLNCFLKRSFAFIIHSYISIMNRLFDDILYTEIIYPLCCESSCHIRTFSLVYKCWYRLFVFMPKRKDIAIQYLSLNESLINNVFCDYIKYMHLHKNWGATHFDHAIRRSTS